MNDAASLALALVAGALLGAFYFGTLWLVVRRLDRLAWPGVWLAATSVARLAIVLALFALLVGPRWERVTAALAGFLAVRLLLTRWLGRSATIPGPRTREGT